MYCDLFLFCEEAKISGSTEDGGRSLSFTGLLPGDDAHANRWLELSACALSEDSNSTIADALASISSEEAGMVACAAVFDVMREQIDVVAAELGQSEGNRSVAISYVLWEPVYVEQEQWEMTDDGEPYPVPCGEWEREPVGGDEYEYVVNGF